MFSELSGVYKRTFLSSRDGDTGRKGEVADARSGMGRGENVSMFVDNVGKNDG